MIFPSQTFSGMFPQFFKRIHSQSFCFLCHHVSRKSGLNRNLILNSPMSVPILDLTPLGPSPPQRFPLGVPIKIANINEKLNSRGGGGEERTMGRGERAFLLSFPFPSCPGMLPFSFIPGFLRHKEADQQRGDPLWCTHVSI